MSQHVTPNKPALPEKVQESINIASEKVKVLNDEAILVSKAIGEGKKELARLEISKETLDIELPKLEEQVVGLNASIEQKIKELAERSGEIDALVGDIKKAGLELAKLEKAREKSILERSAVVEGMREATIEDGKRRDALNDEIAEFEERKERLIEVIKTV